MKNISNVSFRRGQVGGCVNMVERGYESYFEVITWRLHESLGSLFSWAKYTPTGWAGSCPAAFGRKGSCKCSFPSRLRSEEANARHIPSNRDAFQCPKEIDGEIPRFLPHGTAVRSRSLSGEGLERAEISCSERMSTIGEGVQKRTRGWTI